MMRAILAFTFSILAGTASAGTLTYQQFYSDALHQNRAFGLYLPTGYVASDSVRYPVIYKLHGAFSDQTSDWDVLKDILDDLISAGEIAPVIVVSPNGSAGSWGGSMWTNSQLYGLFEDYVVRDLVAFVDSAYKTIPIPPKRALLGFSMGAIGSMTIGLTHPDVFGAIAAHSGFFNWDRFREDYRTAVLNENPGPPYIYNPGAGQYTVLMFTVAGGYSPNPQSWPYQVDLPLDSNGDIVEPVIDRWIAHNPDVLAAAQPPGHWPRIYFDCGIYDHLFMYVTNLDLAAAFDSAGVPYVFRSFVGGHFLNSESLQISLAFLDEALTAETWSNAGGCLVVHDTGLTYTSSMSIPPESPVPLCPDVDDEIPLDTSRVWKVYAAFPDSLPPRVKSLTWGVDPSAIGGGGVVISGWGLADPVGDAEVTEGGWPNSPGSGVYEVFGTTRTAQMIECYWFGGYAYAGQGGEPQLFSTGAHPTLGGLFVDDGWPVRQELIAGFGSIGFGQGGTTPCPTAGVLGACCDADGGCSLTAQSDCSPPAIWHGEWDTCSPNPCISSAPEQTYLPGSVSVQVAPNPGAASVGLRISGPPGVAAEVRIFDAGGRLVCGAWEGKLEGGAVAITWNRRDRSGRLIPAGVYWIRLMTPVGESRARLVLTR